MMSQRRGRLVLVVLGGLVAAASLGLGLWLGLPGGGHKLTRREYLTRVSTVCRIYAHRLARVGAPSDVTAYGDVIAAVNQVLPLLRKQAAAMQGVEPPSKLEPRLDTLFALNRSSVSELEAALRAARRRDAGGVAKGLVAFSQLRDRTHALATAIGIDCTAG